MTRPDELWVVARCLDAERLASARERAFAEPPRWHRVLVHGVAIGGRAPAGPSWAGLELVAFADRAAAERHAAAPCGTRARADLMTTTPAANWPSVDEPWSRPVSLPLIVEYIDVCAAGAAEYLATMTQRCGPAARRCTELGLFHGFLALETVHTVVDDASLPTWNQIHVSAMPTRDAAAWRRDFATSFDAAAGDPNAFERTFARLDAIRTLPHVVWAADASR